MKFDESYVAKALVKRFMVYFFSHAVYLVQCCTLYGSATHIANPRYRTSLAKKGELGPH